MKTTTQLRCQAETFTFGAILRKAALVSAATLALAPAAHAEDNQYSLWQQTKDHASRIWNQGDDAIYLSGVAHHGRSTYSRDKLNELNEHAWGAGYGKTLRNEHGNDDSLYGCVITSRSAEPSVQSRQYSASITAGCVAAGAPPAPDSPPAPLPGAAALPSAASPCG